LRVYPTAVLAHSSCFLVAAPVDSSVLEPDHRVTGIVKGLLEGRHRGFLEGLDDYTLARAIAALYGGLVLVYRCSGPVPLARISVEERITIKRTGSRLACPLLSDRRILDSWALIQSGDALKGLQHIAGCTASPRGHYWHVGGDSRILPFGIDF